METKHALHLLWFLFMWLHLETRFLPFFLWILNVFYFGILKFQSFNFLLIILGVFNFFVRNFTKGKKGYFPFFLWSLKIFVLVFWSSIVFNFLLMNFESFLFWYFEILESSFSFSSFEGSFIFLCEVSQGGKGGIYLFSCELWRIFSFDIWKFLSFQFSSYHFGGL